MCLAGGAAAEKRVARPESCATCRRARPETSVPSEVRGPLREHGGAPFHSPASPGASALSHTWSRKSDFGAVRVAVEPGSTRVAQRRGPRARGFQFPCRSAWPRRQARGTGWPRATPLLPATVAFPRWKLELRVPVAMGRGRRDPELIGSRLLSGGAHGSQGGGEDSGATAVSARQMPPLRSPTQ